MGPVRKMLTNKYFATVLILVLGVVVVLQGIRKLLSCDPVPAA